MSFRHLFPRSSPGIYCAKNLSQKMTDYVLYEPLYTLVPRYLWKIPSQKTRPFKNQKCSKTYGNSVLNKKYATIRLWYNLHPLDRMTSEQCGNLKKNARWLGLWDLIASFEVLTSFFFAAGNFISAVFNSLLLPMIGKRKKIDYVMFEVACFYVGNFFEVCF